MATTPAITDATDVENLRIETVRDGNVVRVAFHGEADFSMLRHLDGALRQAQLDGAELVQLDVDQLGFADVATIRRLALFAREAKHAGRDVRTDGASHTFRTVARLLEVQGDLGLG